MTGGGHHGSVCTAHICLSKIDPPCKLNIWFKITYVVVTNQNVKHVPLEWTRQFISIRHSHRRGVSNGEWKIRLFHRRDQTHQEFQIGSAAMHNMSCILDTTVGYGLPCVAPMSIIDREPKVIKIRPCTYHGGRLFPLRECTAYVVAPNVFSPTNWC